VAGHPAATAVALAKTDGQGVIEMVDRYLSRALAPGPRSRQYDPVLTLPASVRDSVLAVQDIAEISIIHLGSPLTRIANAARAAF